MLVPFDDLAQCGRCAVLEEVLSLREVLNAALLILYRTQCSPLEDAIQSFASTLLSGAVVTTQSVRCWLCKRKDLHPTPRSPVGSPCAEVHCDSQF